MVLKERKVSLRILKIMWLCQQLPLKIIQKLIIKTLLEDKCFLYSIGYSYYSNDRTILRRKSTNGHFY